MGVWRTVRGGVKKCVGRGEGGVGKCVKRCG